MIWSVKHTPRWKKRYAWLPVQIGSEKIWLEWYGEQMLGSWPYHYPALAKWSDLSMPERSACASYCQAAHLESGVYL